MTRNHIIRRLVFIKTYAFYKRKKINNALLFTDYRHTGPTLYPQFQNVGLTDTFWRPLF